MADVDDNSAVVAVADNPLSPTVTQIPTFTGRVEQRFIVEPLNAGSNPEYYTDRFPDEVYNKATESHIMRFLWALIGPSGVGWLREQIFQARLIFEQEGMELFDLDRFYGNPFKFGRVVEEVYEEDPRGVLPRKDWEKIRVADEAYRTRAIDYLNAAKAGNTPLGMMLAARSGLGHDVEIVENYRYLFDQHSDDPIGVPYMGKTSQLNEMIVLPRRSESRSEEQTIELTGTVTGGTFRLRFRGAQTDLIDYDADWWTIKTELEDLPSIKGGNVQVTGGPGPLNPWKVKFQGILSNQDVPAIQVIQLALTGSETNAIVTTEVGGQASVDEIVVIPPKDQHTLQTALDRLKPVGVLPTTSVGTGTRQMQDYISVHASSEYNEVIRYVTGSAKVKWPAVSSSSWIEPLKEKEGRRSANDLQYHYVGFHSPQSVTTTSQHVGLFSYKQRTLLGAFDYLRENTDDSLVFGSDRVMADYYEPLTVTTQTTGDTPVQLVNGIYPASYAALPGVPSIKYKDEQFWASMEKVEGIDSITLDLGTARAVNFLTFEVCRKPMTIEVFYDSLAMRPTDPTVVPTKRWTQVTPSNSFFTDEVLYSGQELNPWTVAEHHFEDEAGHIPITRFILIRFTRKPFYRLIDPATQVQNPWSIDVRNLRVGRNVTSY